MLFVGHFHDNGAAQSWELHKISIILLFLLYYSYLVKSSASKSSTLGTMGVFTPTGQYKKRTLTESQLT